MDLHDLDTSASPDAVTLAYDTSWGQMIVGRVEDALSSPLGKRLRGDVNLVFTSPPFPLVRKKRYGNETGDKYVAWLESLAPLFADLLAPDGSIVIEVGNAWEPGQPTMSTLPLEALLAFKRAGGFHLCQQVICHNPARLPGPAQWVTVDRTRLKDSYTHVWWMSKSPHPNADNRRVLSPYSKDMKRLLKKQSYNAGTRPSGHRVSQTGFLGDFGGSISANVLEMSADQSKLPEDLLKYSGTAWDKGYRAYCLTHNLEPHPARMQLDLAAFFIRFLTEETDLVFDPFAGSNTTGAAAEDLQRRWISVEANATYAEGSKGRFPAHFS